MSTLDELITQDSLYNLCTGKIKFSSRDENIRLISHKNVDCNKCNNSGFLPLNLVMTTTKHSVNNNHLIGLLINHGGANSKAFNQSGENCLHFAVRFKKIEAIIILCSLDYDKSLINSQDNEGNTVLHIASSNLLKLLIDLGADQNIPNNKNLTPLQRAEEFNREEKIKILEMYQIPPTIFSLYNSQGLYSVYMKKAKLIPEEEKILNAKIMDSHSKDSFTIAKFLDDLILHSHLRHDVQMFEFLVNSNLGNQTFKLIPELTKDDCYTIFNQNDTWFKINNYALLELARNKKVCITYSFVEKDY